MEQKLIYTVEEVASLVGMHANSIYAYLRSGRLKGVKTRKGYGGTWRISRAELEDWWRQQGGGKLFEEAG